MLIDVHAHLFDSNMPVTPAEAIAAAQKVGVTQFVVPGYSLTTSGQSVELAREFPGVCFATIGIHPHEVVVDGFDLAVSIGELEQMLAPKTSMHDARDTTYESTDPESRISGLVPRPVGVGEIGIDYHHHTREETGSIQREAFAAQLQLGLDHDLPIIIHGRKAYDDVLDVIRAHPGSRGLLHSFEADYDVAKQALDLGWMISFTALVTYPGNEYLLDVAKKLPVDRITVETDAPYLPPRSVRVASHDARGTNDPKLVSRTSKLVIGKRGVNNQPAYMVETAQKLADVRGTSLMELAEATTATARSLFRLPVL